MASDPVPPSGEGRPSNEADDRRRVGHTGRLNAAQRSCMEHLEEAAERFGRPPEGLTGPGALAELWSKTAYGGEPSALVPLDIDSFALSAVGFAPVDIASIGGTFGRRVVTRLTQKILPAHLLREKEENDRAVRAYYALVLRHRHRVYARFIRRLRDAGLVEMRGGCDRRIGAFAVRKKNGEQR